MVSFGTVTMKKCIYALLIVMSGYIGGEHEGWQISGNHININVTHSK